MLKTTQDVDTDWRSCFVSSRHQLFLANSTQRSHLCHWIWFQTSWVIFWQSGWARHFANTSQKRKFTIDRGVRWTMWTALAQPSKLISGAECTMPLWDTQNVRIGESEHWKETRQIKPLKQVQFPNWLWNQVVSACSLSPSFRSFLLVLAVCRTDVRTQSLRPIFLNSFEKKKLTPGENR